MRSLLIVFILVSSTNLVNAQQWSIESTIGISYSGINHTVRGSFQKNQLQVAIGPKANYSKSNLPWSRIPGVSLLVGYDILASTKVKSQGMLLYEVLPLNNAVIQEVYLGYRMQYLLKQKWKIQNSVGFGGYSETANNTINYSINGLSYCVNFGLSYRL
ncbi:MAG: hypothetical protein ACI9JN_002526 [Bacteroidia bacterium]|jgi:hypothetical protein